MDNDVKQNLEILKGGCNVPVSFEDGRSEELFVRKVSLRNMDTLGRAWGKMSEEFRVYTGRNPETDPVDDESFLTVIQEGRRLNFTCFEKWLKISMQTLQPFGAAGINIEELVKKAAETLAANEAKNGQSDSTQS